MNVKLPSSWERAFSCIEEIFKGFSHAWIVGGMSRYMTYGGEEPEDMDIVIFSESEKEQAINALKSAAGPPQVIRGGEALRFTLYGKPVDIVQPKAGGIKEDALLRDFTFNAIYVHPFTGDVEDPLKALVHLKKRLLLTPQIPEITFTHDPARMLRMARFAVELNLEIHRDVLSCCTRLKGLLRHTSQERIGEQMRRILLSDRIADILMLVAELKLVEYVIPEMARAVGFDQKTPYHVDDVYTHSVKAASLVEKDLALRCAALLHDAGKPLTSRWKNGRLTYPGHEAVSAHLTNRALRRWAFPKEIRKETVELVKKHTVIYTPGWTDKAVRRFIRRTEGIMEKLFKLVEADIKARGPLERSESLRLLDELKGRVEALLQEIPASMLRSPLNGNEIMQILGIEPGPLVGELKRALENLVIEGTLAPDDKEGARMHLIRLFKEKAG